MKLDEPRSGVFTLTLSAHELSTLLAGARMSLRLMQDDPTQATADAREALAAVLGAFDDLLGKLKRPLG